jgi:hypothetical protein
MLLSNQNGIELAEGQSASEIEDTVNLLQLTVFRQRPGRPICGSVFLLQLTRDSD